MFKEGDIIKTKIAYEEAGVRAGDIGTIICVYETPEEAYEVEFINETGAPKHIAALKADELELYQEGSISD